MYIVHRPRYIRELLKACIHYTHARTHARAHARTNAHTSTRTNTLTAEFFFMVSGFVAENELNCRSKKILDSHSYYNILLIACDGMSLYLSLQLLTRVKDTSGV